MSDEQKHTAYCGLYCRDCIPSNRGFFELVNGLREQLGAVGFERYAALKAERLEVFRDYETFARVLEAISGLQCAAPCREGGGNPGCVVRRCAIRKGYAGCWECEDFRECARLEPLRRYHGSNINHNLEMIREHGPEGWTDRRGRHYPWSE